MHRAAIAVAAARHLQCGLWCGYSAWTRKWWRAWWHAAPRPVCGDPAPSSNADTRQPNGRSRFSTSSLWGIPKFVYRYTAMPAR
eukprot:5276427-Prymnesium_polylepis.4